MNYHLFTDMHNSLNETNDCVQTARKCNFKRSEKLKWMNVQRQKCQCQSKIFSVAKIAKLLRRPRGRTVIRAQCQEKTGENHKPVIQMIIDFPVAICRQS